MAPEKSGFFRQWQKMGWGLRVLCISLPVIGVFGAVAGFIGDFFDWWSNSPFATNFLSGVTSACFGVPFAILILGTLNSDAVEETRRRESVNVRDAALLELLRSAEYLRKVDGDLVVKAVMGLMENMEDVHRRGVQDWYESNSWRVSDWLMDVHRALFRPIPVEADGAAWVALTDRWRFLRDYVRLRVYESGERWLSPETFGSLDELLGDPKSPVDDAEELYSYCSAYFSQMHRVDGREEEMIEIPTHGEGLIHLTRRIAGRVMMRLEHIQRDMEKLERDFSLDPR